MAFSPMNVSGGTEMPQIVSGAVSGTTNTTYTYTANADCLFSVFWTVTYSYYGYRVVNVNGTEILNDTTKNSYIDVIYLKSGDSITITLESSTTPATYSIALL